MQVARAKETARGWVAEIASGLPGYRGAFFHGSVNDLSEDDVFPPTSDLDVGIVLAEGARHPKLGKTQRGGVLVEGAVISETRLATADQVLGDYRLCPSFRTHSVISDPTGNLGKLEREVERHFAQPQWILARCEDAQRNCLRYIHSLEPALPLHQQASILIFAEGVLTHVLLAAGLRNPTVRRRYSAARELLATVGRLDVHETLLSMLGCAALSESRVEHHLDRMTEAFDRAAAVLRSEFPFSGDIAAAARPVAVDGSRALVARGEPREAIFWIAATFARCVAVLEADGTPDDVREHEPMFRELLRDLGIASFRDMRQRAAEAEAFLPDLMEISREIAAAGRYEPPA